MKTCLILLLTVLLASSAEAAPNRETGSRGISTRLACELMLITIGLPAWCKYKPT
jgi:hypothetical protein